VSLGEDGVLRFRSLPGASHTLEDARENVRAARELTESGKLAPNLVDFSGIQSMTRDARAYYAGPETAEVMTAVAILVDSFLSRAMGNFFMGLNKPLMPTRLFSSETEALSWLRGFRK
jgi:hypothetical protein